MDKGFSPQAKRLLFWSLLTMVLVLVSVFAFGILAPTVYFYVGNRYYQAQIDSMRDAAIARMHDREAQSKVAHLAQGGHLPELTNKVLTDNAQDGTENNYLARTIAQDIERQAYWGMHPDQSLPSVQVKATVNVDPPYRTQIFFLNWPGNSELTVDLAPSFAWDARAYAKVADAVIGKNSPAQTATPDPDADHLLEVLLEPTGRKLAVQDVRLSALLQKNPLNAQAQEEAALVLITMALREQGNDFRLLLCRATAHLALADSLQSGAPSWNNRVADAALRVISGREVESMPLLDGMKNDPACPPAVKSWTDALTIWAKQDVRGIDVTAGSPRLVRIAWFDVLTQNSPVLAAVAQLEALGTPDPITDWTKAVLAQPLTVETGNRFCPSCFNMEKKEMAEILEAESASPMDGGHLDAFFAEPETETVGLDGSGRPVLHVIGVGTFKNATRENLFGYISATHQWLARMLGDEEGAKSFVGETEVLYRGVPYFECIEYALDGASRRRGEAAVSTRLRDEGKSWDISKLRPYVTMYYFGQNRIAAQMANDYFLAGPPIGTAYQDQSLVKVIHGLDIPRQWHLSPTDTNPGLRPKLLFLQRLQEMKPSSLELAQAIVLEQGRSPSGDIVMQNLSRFLDYNVHAFEFIEDHQPMLFVLSDTDAENVLKKHCALNPDIYFEYGDYLTKKGRVDEAAEAFRAGVAKGNDQVLMSVNVDNLINYDWDHNKKDEALAIAQKAAQVYSMGGLNAYLLLLDKMGNLPEAEKQGIAIRDRYNDSAELAQLYARHPDFFHGQFEILRKQTFPQGLTPVTLASFQGPPKTGTLIKTSSAELDAADMRPGDVIVALDGSLVENMAQYDFLREQSKDPTLHLIVWQNDHYVEVKASPPEHRFGVDLDDYHLDNEMSGSYGSSSALASRSAAPPPVSPSSIPTSQPSEPSPITPPSAPGASSVAPSPSTASSPQAQVQTPPLDPSPPPSTDAEEATNQKAFAVAQSFLALIDQGKYADAYALLPDDAKAMQSQDYWLKYMQVNRVPTGDIASRAFQTLIHLDMNPNASHTIALHFMSSFWHSKTIYMEEVKLEQGKDGAWRASSYSIRLLSR